MDQNVAMVWACEKNGRAPYGKRGDKINGKWSPCEWWTLLCMDGWGKDNLECQRNDWKLHKISVARRGMKIRCEDTVVLE